MSERRNPEALHEAAAGWRDMGTHLDGLVRDLDRHVGDVAANNWHGPAGEAFAGEWHRLKSSVDDSLPAFELAAVSLESAAEQPADKGGEDHGGDPSPAPANHGSSGGQQSGTNFAYGFMALGQLANGLGGAFRKRGGGGGGRQGPTATHQWETSTAAHGPDPFGRQSAGGTTRGGENIAKGVRTDPAAAAERAAKDAKGADAKAGDEKPGKVYTSEPSAGGAFG
ncbi:WXG100 family type VII secretion target [Streptomyces sp. NPDC048650]|uniref:WXG100 family type VII secretion target n=1 Tax=unclassified Streptomyces TaxID=2593676 RepID=UPI00371DCC50